VNDMQEVQARADHGSPQHHDDNYSVDPSD
jgi:hypothetical protein